MKIVILDGSAANPGDITWGALEDIGEVIAYDTTSKDQLSLISNISAFSRPATT